MPELPDVESFKRYLDATSLHQRIDAVNVRNAHVLQDVSGPELARQLNGRQFECSRRHGKHLFVRADNRVWLRLHFGMTGFLNYFKDDKNSSPHVRVTFAFASGYRLAFDDQRMFGEVELVEDLDAFVKKRGLGPDALAINLAQFKELFAKHRGNVKAALLNQELLAGIGNIYADEILFRARTHPATNIVDLNDKTRAAIFRAMRYILEKAVAAKADADLIPKSWLLSRRRKSGKCSRCGRKLSKAKIGGRTTWFCTHCQKRPS